MDSIEMTAEQKMAKTMLVLRRLRPFYSALYENIEHIKTSEVKTMGVTSNKLYYNENFIDKIDTKTLVFCDLHEIAHIALMHPSRMPKVNLLLNIAADAMVNKLLSEEFDIFPGIEGEEITMPDNCIYCSSIDTSKDSVEDLYYELKKQLDNEIEKGNEHIVLKLSGGLMKDEDYRRDNYSIVEININIIEMDLMQNNNNCDSEVIDNVKAKISSALVKAEMESKKGAGNAAGGIEILVSDMLKSKIDWRKLLRKYCRTIISKESSFSRPDKRMYYQKAIYPGNINNENQCLKDVKICFDTSGSISDEDLMYFFGQIDLLLKEYKVDAEMIYWDAEVESSGLFKDMKDLRYIHAAGRGGTDPNCLFEYFDSAKCKIKPYVTVIFTDGYFNLSDLKKTTWKRKYKNTIWVMTRDYDKSFEPPFGKKAIATFYE